MPYHYQKSEFMDFTYVNSNVRHTYGYVSFHFILFYVEIKSRIPIYLGVVNIKVHFHQSNSTTINMDTSKWTNVYQ